MSVSKAPEARISRQDFGGRRSAKVDVIPLARIFASDKIRNVSL